MSKIKNYMATLADCGDGVADPERALEVEQEREFERAYKEYDYNKLRRELGK